MSLLWAEPQQKPQGQTENQKITHRQHQRGEHGGTTKGEGLIGGRAGELMPVKKRKNDRCEQTYEAEKHKSTMSAHNRQWQQGNTG